MLSAISGVRLPQNRPQSDSPWPRKKKDELDPPLGLAQRLCRERFTAQVYVMVRI